MGIPLQYQLRVMNDEKSIQMLRQIGRSRSGRYEFCFEIAGDAAMFNQPEGDMVTYPIPTIAACESWVKSIGVVEYAVAVITKVEVLRPLRYFQYSFVNTTPVRYAPNVKKRVGDMLSATALRDVRYRVHGYTLSDGRPHRNNNAHYYQHLLLRRIEKGLYRKVPYMGWKDFPANYVGPATDATPCENLNLVIPKMYQRMFNTFKGGEIDRTFGTVEIKEGVVDYEACSAVSN